MLRLWTAVVLACPFLLTLALEPIGSAQGQNTTEPMNVGLMRSLFDETDEDTLMAQMRPFTDLVRKQTNVPGEFVLVKNVDKMREDLKSGALSLGVVLGLDYAWLRESCSEAEPLLIALNEIPFVKVHVLVPKDSPAKSLADLRGKSLALSEKTLRFIRYYLEHEVNSPLDKFFAVKTVPNADAAIEAVVEREAELTVVATQGLEVYRERKPGRFNRLRVLQESIDFPTGAIIYIPGKVKQEALNQFRDAMLKAHERPEARQTLTLWRLTQFDKPPKDFVKKVDELAKKYPANAK